MNVREIKNLLPDFKSYTEQVSQAKFSDVVSQGQKYSDISTDVDSVEIYNQIESIVGYKPQNVLSFLRAYVDRPEYRHPMWIHSDVMFADCIGVLFVQSSEFPEDDGLAHWRNRDLNMIELESKDPTRTANRIADMQSRDPRCWELMNRFEFEHNKLVIMPASYFHSTVTYGHHGKTLDTCRIVHVLFWNVPKENK